ncbi:MAG: MFS transporter [Pseudomonadota bacterium]
MTAKHWTIIICGSIIVMVAMGVRQSFGLFVQPVGMDLAVGRDVMGLAIAISNLVFGLVQPVVGAIADRYGAGRVIVGGTIIYIAGLLLMAVSADPLQLHLTLGVLTGLGLAGTTYVVVLGAIGRAVPLEHRSRAFGVATAVGSFGMFALVPGTQALINQVDWQGALVALSIMLSVMAVLAYSLSGKPQAADDAGPDQSLGMAVRVAFQHRGYWLLNAGFFVCGFHVTFMAVHYQPYLLDQGVTAFDAALGFAMIGLFNIFGSLFFGELGGRYRKKYLLSFLYVARAVAIAVFLMLPVTATTGIIFGAVIGFLWLATVPLTSGLVGQIFGTRYLSTLYGVVFLWHQVGSFFGAWLGGEVFERFGSYEPIWLASIALGIVAALIHFPIEDKPVTVPQGQTA